MARGKSHVHAGVTGLIRFAGSMSNASKAPASVRAQGGKYIQPVRITGAIHARGVDGRVVRPAAPLLYRYGASTNPPVKLL